MKIVRLLLIVIVALLSIAAGAAKVIQAPQEMEFLQGFGLSTLSIIVFGLVQILAGVLLAPQKTRISGATLAIIAFAVSTILIFKGGNFAFALFSILPIVLSIIVVYQTADMALRKPE